MVFKGSRSRKCDTESVGRATYVFEAMEPRILLSADPVGAAVADVLHGDDLDQKFPKELQAPDIFPVVVESTSNALGSDATPAAGSLSVFPPPLELDGLALLSVPPFADAIQPAFEPAHELVFVDAGVQDYQQLLDELASGIVLLNASPAGPDGNSVNYAYRDIDGDGATTCGQDNTPGTSDDDCNDFVSGSIIIDPNEMRLNRVGCFDVGVHCGGWGHVVLEVKIEDRK